MDAELKARDSKNTGLSDLQNLVEIEKLQFLYQQSVPATIINLATGSLLTRIFWLYDSNKTVLIWYGLLLALSIVRIAIFISYYRSSPQGNAVLSWSLPYFFSLIALSMLWGFGGLILMPAESLLYQAIVFYFLMGMCAGAMAVYSTNQSYALSTVYLILGPSMIWALFQSSHISFYMGLGALIFLVSAARVTKIIAMSQHDNFVRKYQLTEAEAKAARLESIDSLTGLCNRRAFEEDATLLLDHRKANVKPFSLMIIGVDHLQKVNDSFSYQAGDEVLRTIAGIIDRSILENDVCARLGGDEFVILLPDAENDMGALLAERLITEMSAQQFHHDSDDFSVSVSIGIAQNTGSLKMALDEANKALAEAKRKGRNQFTIFHA